MVFYEYEIYEYDVVVVGVGGVGLCVMFGMVEQGLCMVCVIKVFLICFYIVVVQGGIVVLLGNMGFDSWQWYMYDIVKGLDWLGDIDVMEYFVCEVFKVVYELEYYGVLFSCIEEGKIYQCLFGGYIIEFGEGFVVQWICVVVDWIGYVILYILYGQLLKQQVEFYIEYFVVDLIMSDDGVCIGVVCWKLDDGIMYVFNVKMVVLVIGGYGCVYFLVILVYICMGDGGGMVVCVGLLLQDMEFVQFYLIGIYGLGCLIIEGVCGEGGYLINLEGECFMECYVLQYKDLVLCDYVLCCMIMEICEGCGVGVNGDYISLNLNYLFVEVLVECLLGILESVKIFVGVDVIKELIFVLLIVYYNMGGILINYWGEVLNLIVEDLNVIVLGLMVVGEVGCVLVYGVNCFGLNLLIDFVVFGCVVVICVGEVVDCDSVILFVNIVQVDKVFDCFDGLCYVKGNMSMVELCLEMQCIMQVDVVVFCIDKILKVGVEKMIVVVVKMDDLIVIDILLIWNFDLMEMFELINLMLNVLVMIVGVEVCKESCGVYVYEDYVICDDENWCVYIISYVEGNKVDLIYCLVIIDLLINEDQGGISFKKIVLKEWIF